MRAHWIFGLLIAFNSCARAQERQNGWAKLGQAVGGSQTDEAFQRGMMRGLRLQNALNEAREAEREAQRLRVQENWRRSLEGLWSKGLPAAEAASVAATYQFNYEKQLAVGERIQREGWQTGVDAAWKAYHDYDYQRANEILVATILVKELADKRASAQQAKSDQ